MKKIIKTFPSPSGLTDYLANNPLDTWDQFRGNEPAACNAVKNQLVRDQGGLCAYCEIDTHISINGVGLDDFRVEHFHPKGVEGNHNYGLDWENLLGVCHGGSQQYVAIPSRHTSPDHSCDVPKGNQKLKEVILDPVKDVPAFPNIFEYIELGVDAGKVVVDKSNCPPGLQAKAEQTINKLCLDAPRLNRLRKDVIDKLREEISNAIDSGQAMEDAMNDLAMAFFTPTANGYWQPFFSCIRWYLGSSAEKQLHAISYQG